MGAFDWRLRRHPLLELRRGPPLTFTFDGRPIRAYGGETVAGALYAAGVRVFSRSFKYHRPRGPFCLQGHCCRCLMRVNGVPNVRTCMTEVEPGMVVESQHRWPSRRYDLGEFTDIFGWLFPPGFYYRYFSRQRRLYHLWERLLSRRAGLGELGRPPELPPPRLRRQEVEVLVVGGGLAGMAAAKSAAQAGAQVWLLEKERELGGTWRHRLDQVEIPELAGQPLTAREVSANLAAEIRAAPTVEVYRATTAVGWYDEGDLAAVRAGELLALRPRALVVCTGSYDQPWVFTQNDLPGIFSLRGLERLLHRDRVRPGERAVVAASNGDGGIAVRALQAAGIEVMAVIACRGGGVDQGGRAAASAPEVPLYRGQILAAGGHRRLRWINAAVEENGRLRRVRIQADVLCLVGPQTPANDLLFQRLSRGSYVLEAPGHLRRLVPVADNLEVEPGLYVAGGANCSFTPRQVYLEGSIAGAAAASRALQGGP